MAKVWLVTGSGSGLGRDIVQAALSAGDQVVAGARRPEELASFQEEYGARIVPVALDVREEQAAQSAVQVAINTFCRLDVLVNNAGYQFNAPFEQISPEVFRDVIETCFFGVVYTTRAALPTMRQQKSGYIFQVSSIGGRVTIPGNSPYHAAKWAVGGFSDSLADEVAPFHVKVCTLEPGGMRTDFARRAHTQMPELLPEYRSSVGPTYERMAASRTKSEGDPKRVAKVIVDLSRREHLPKRLILGTAAAAYVHQVETERSEEAKAYGDLTDPRWASSQQFVTTRSIGTQLEL